MISALALSVIMQSGASPASYVALPQPPSPTAVSVHRQDYLLYLNEAATRPVARGVETELLGVWPGAKSDERPTSRSMAYRFDCEWGLQQFLPSSADATWTEPFFVQSLPHFAALEQTCGLAADPLTGERFDSLRTAFADGIRRLGYEDVDAALQLELKTYLYSGPPSTPAPIRSAPERFELVYQPDSLGRAVFIERPAGVGESPTESGRSVWVLGVGQPEAKRRYAYRDYALDCRVRMISLRTTEAWPQPPGARSAMTPSETASKPLVKAAADAGSASAALIDAVCGALAPPVQTSGRLTVASIDQIVAYADDPNEDPAFSVLAQERIYSGMRWEAVPSSATVTAAYPQGSLRTGETKQTHVECVVSREYRLVRCEPIHPNREDEPLQTANLTLAGEFRPATTTTMGRPTVGRRVVLSILWSPEGSQVKLL